MKYVVVFFYFLFYLLDNHLSSLKLKQNNMAHLNQCLLLNKEKNRTMLYSKLNPNFLFDLHQGMVTNEHQYVIKNGIKC
jgi:hypothetical protein